MFGKHVVKELSAYLHGELAAEAARRVADHLKECRKCSEAYEEIRFGAQLMTVLPKAKADFSINTTPENFLRLRPIGLALRGATPPHLRRRIAGAFATIAVAFAITLLLYRNVPVAGPAWEVAELEGKRELRVGEELRTASSVARVKIADIGQLTVSPNSRLRLLETRKDAHRIALERGKVEALTWAPPRLFFVETPSAVAVDLGCQYTLEVEDDGSSLLHVTLGLVALQLNGRESMVPRSAFCRTRVGTGPGTPFFDDSSDAFRTALDFVDFGKGTERAHELETLLHEARPRDTLTLWHLLPRLDSVWRGRVYDRMAELAAPPGSVTRDGILALDLKMLDVWRDRLADLW